MLDGLDVCCGASGLVVAVLVRVFVVLVHLVVIVVYLVLVALLASVLSVLCCNCRNDLCSCGSCIFGISICGMFLVLSLRLEFRRLGMCRSGWVPILHKYIVVLRLVDVILFVCVD